jgi:hypothetical protein
MADNDGQPDHAAENGPRKVSFADFIFLQYQQGRFSLGQFPNPETGKYEENLSLAQYSIGVLSMLKEKTQGNVTEQEEKLLENILHELRLTYVEKLHAAASKTKKTGVADSQAAAPAESAAEQQADEAPADENQENSPSAENEDPGQKDA